MTRYQPFNDLPARQFQALRDDVEVHGIVNPIVVDEHDNVIDGHQRRKVAAELHIECPRMVIEGLTETEKKALAITLNTLRRHFTPSERQAAVQELVNLGMSQRRISDATGIPRRTVRRDIESGGPSGPPANVDPETGEIKASRSSGQSDGTSSDAAAPGNDGTGTAPSPSPEPEPAPRVTGKDGKSYPATKPPTVEQVDPDAGYRATASREFSKVRSGLLTLDPERVASICLPDDRAAYLAFASDVSNWLLALSTALDGKKNLRSVK